MANEPVPPTSPQERSIPRPAAIGSGEAIALIRDGFPARAAYDTAISKAILKLVSDGSQPETLRLYRPGAIVAFGPQDASSSGYRAAIEAARNKGFSAVLRLAGGRAAVYHPQTIAFSWAIPSAEPKRGIPQRFEIIAGLMSKAFTRLGIDARIGEVKGEYCPGAYSVSARGQRKLMGVGQRLEAKAAHIGGVVVVGDSSRVRDVLVPVYQALRLEWDPTTTGSLQDEVPGLAYDTVVKAILAEFAAAHILVPSALPPKALDLAETLERDHLAA